MLDAGISALGLDLRTPAWSVGAYTTFVLPVTFETERLILRPFVPDDFDAFAVMYADPIAARTVTEDGRPLSRFAAWRAFAGILGHWTLRGFGMFAVIEQETGTFVGRVGAWEPEAWPDFEIGWMLRSEYWGRGYATEAAMRCIAYAFTDLHRDHISSFIAPENMRSIRVAERIGERLEGEVTLPDLPHRPHLRYGISRAEWEPTTARAISVGERSRA